MTPTFTPSPPGNEKGRSIAGSGRHLEELGGTLSLTVTPSSPPLVIVRKRWQYYACRLWQVWIKTGNRRHFVAFRRHVDAMAANHNGGRP